MLEKLIALAGVGVIAQTSTWGFPVDIDHSSRTGDSPSPPGVRTIFTPDVEGTTNYLAWLDKVCKKKLLVADYTFTSTEVAQKYCDLADKGVAVQVILDKSESQAVKSETALIAQLRAHKIEVVITQSKDHAIMHCKFTIADDLYVENGSWNYTKAADSQDNVLEFDDAPHPARATIFNTKWCEMYDYGVSQQKQNARGVAERKAARWHKQ